MTAPWLHTLALASLALAVVSALAIAADILAGRRQEMAVMNAVWPLTGLYFGPLACWAYFTFGRQPAPEPAQRGHASAALRRKPAQAAAKPAGRKGGECRGRPTPTLQQVFVGTTHCGAGCTLGDLAGEWSVYVAGWTLAGLAFWPELIADFCLAFLLGVVFQYLTIAPMRHLGFRAGVAAALKADTLSITAFEVGMFVWMALTRFVFFPQGLHPTQPVYWFMMQLAMVVGFATSFPMNYWLIRKGLKEAM